MQQLGPLLTWSEVTHVPGSPKKRALATPVTFWLNGHHLCDLPKGFEWDGNSFPWFSRLTWDDPWHERYVVPSLLHDGLLWLCATGQLDAKKHQVDWLYMGALRACKVSALETWIFSTAVRVKRTFD